jgi:pyruvate-formate lyase-activating enzyme
MKQIARVIMTWDCNRDCDLCCNKNLPVQPVTCTVKDLAPFDQVLITGGEPSMYMQKLVDLIETLREQRPMGQEVYLYTALWHPGLKWAARYLDGIHYTLHHPLRHNDLLGFKKFQEMIGDPAFDDKSCRLFMEPRVRCPVPVIPSRWSRVEVKPWLDACPLPDGEVLLQLEVR